MGYGQVPVSACPRDGTNLVLRVGRQQFPTRLSQLADCRVPWAAHPTIPTRGTAGAGGLRCSTTIGRVRSRANGIPTAATTSGTGASCNGSLSAT